MCPEPNQVIPRVSASAARVSNEFCSGYLGCDEALLLFKVCDDFEQFIENVREAYVAALIPACLKVRI
jgi:hypothetical protein